MKQSQIKVIGVTLFIAAFVYFLYIRNRHDEGYTSGFSVTSGLSYYNKPTFCTDGNPEGSSSPYCESLGTVMF